MNFKNQSKRVLISVDVIKFLLWFRRKKGTGGRGGGGGGWDAGAELLNQFFTRKELSILQKKIESGHSQLPVP